MRLWRRRAGAGAGAGGDVRPRILRKTISTSSLWRRRQRPTEPEPETDADAEAGATVYECAGAGSSGSVVSSSSTLVFPLSPTFELELEKAVDMAPSRACAWSYEASRSLRTLTPYPLSMVDTAMSLHAGGWEAALDIGCGLGQLSLHLASRFARVYGQDASARAIQLARTVMALPAAELAEHLLPCPPSAEAIVYAVAAGEAPSLPPGEQVDLIAFGASLQCMDWSRNNWDSWAPLLRPGGSVLVLGTRSVLRDVAPAPLRALLLDLPASLPSLRPFFSSPPGLHTHGLYSAQLWPWHWHHPTPHRGTWDPSSFTYISFPDLGRGLTTPRRQVEWIRSTPGYSRMLAANAEQRIAALTDQDMAAQAVREICASSGIDYEHPIEYITEGVVISFRRHL